MPLSIAPVAVPPEDASLPAAAVDRGVARPAAVLDRLFAAVAD
jgi:hypothetical protein